MSKKQVQVTVVDQEEYDDGPFEFGKSWKDGSLDKVIASLQKIRESIPQEYRESARCMIDSANGYEGEHYAHIEVNYERLETLEEARKRKVDEARQEAEQEARELAEYRQLKAKYGSK